MKKTMVYILALSMLAAALLAGCGETGDNRNDVTRAPDTTGNLPGTDDLMPDELEPDPRDGEVRDEDGFITDADNGGDIIGGVNDGNGLTTDTGGNSTGGGTTGGSGTGGLTVGNSGNGDTGNR